MKKPIDFGFNNKSYKNNLTIIILLWIIAITIVGYKQIIQLYIYKNVKQEFIELETFINDQKNISKNKTDLTKSKKRLEKNLTTNNLSSCISDLINIISKELSSEIMFNRLLINKNAKTITIKGLTKKLSYLTSYINYLNKINTFENIVLESIQENSSNSANPELSFKIKFNILN